MQRILLSPQNLSQAIAEAVTILRSGGLVLYPTETVYGVAVLATNADAVTRLLQYKNRPAGKAISVLVTNRVAAEQLVDLTSEAKKLYQTFLPGPLTVVSQDKGVVDPRLTSEFGTLGIRISSHPVAATLAEQTAAPLTATSANAAGKARPYSIDQVLAGLSARQQSLIDLILDAGQLPPHEPSTVIDTTQAVQEIIRSGELIEQLAPAKQTYSEEETRVWGEQFMKSVAYLLPEQPVVIALEGDLGTGKTQIVKGIAEALQIERPITSPTYTLIKEYAGTAKLVHLDLWRLTQVDPSELALDTYLQPNTVIAIEWATPLLPYLRGQGGFLISLESQGETGRTITLGRL